jgi:hypothetical protein
MQKGKGLKGIEFIDLINMPKLIFPRIVVFYSVHALGEK